MGEFTFESLPLVEDFERLADPANYSTPPSDWWIIVTDVAGSTAAIDAGRYKDVNVLGAASITAARNTSPGVELPYAFGGDGATILVPPELKPAAAAALNGLSEIAEESYGLALRVGGLPVSEVLDRGAEIGIARFRLARPVDLAMFWGDGVGLAEELVKANESKWSFDEEPVSPDLTGLQCRWRPIPSRNGTMLSVLVKATGATAQSRAATYAELFRRVGKLGLGAPQTHPIDVDRLELATDAESLAAESLLKAAAKNPRIADAPRVKWTNIIGKSLMKRGWAFGGFDGKKYPASLVSRTDFRKFDDALRMVVDVDEATRRDLEAMLAEFRADNQIAYGTFASDEALMTCIVYDYETEHVHFIDGSDGGYALAARNMKKQLSEEQ